MQRHPNRHAARPRPRPGASAPYAEERHLDCATNCWIVYLLEAPRRAGHPGAGEISISSVTALKADPVFQECQKIIAEIRARKARLGGRHVASSRFAHRAYGGAWIGR